MPISNTHKGIMFNKTLPLLDIDEKDFLDKEDSKFLYCRGFLICENDNIEITSSFSKSYIYAGNKKFSLYTHNMLDVESACNKKFSIYVFGLSYFTNTKYIDENLSVSEILLSQLEKSKEAFLLSLNSLAGRYCIVVAQNDGLTVYNDACALKSVYYSKNENIFASHLELVNIASNKSLKPSEIELNKQQNNYFYAYAFLGNSTKYDNIYCLTPNFELSFQHNGKTGGVEKRFYPTKQKGSDTLENVKKEYYKIMEISIKELLKKNRKICLSLTGGKDSRVSYYAIKNYAKDIIFFTEDRDNDIEIAKNIASKDNLNWIGVDSKEIHLEDNKLKQGFQNIIVNNVFPHQCQFVLRTQFWNLNIFGCKNYIHIQSNCAEIGRGRKSYGTATGEYPFFSDSWCFENFRDEFIRSMVAWKAKEFKEDQTQKLLQDPVFLKHLQNYYDFLNLDQVKQLGYNPWDFVYNEQRVANFLSQTHMYNDICFESISLTNCREVFEIMWKLPEKDINCSMVLYNEILKENNAE